MQMMFQLQAFPNQAEQLKHWCLHEWGMRLAQSDAVQKVIVNLALPEIQLLPYGSAESLQGEALDAIVQIWPSPKINTAEFIQQQLLEAAGQAAVVHIYQVTDTEVLNRQNLGLSLGQMPGIKIMRGLFLFDDLPDQAAQRMWAHHSNLAAKVHIGLSRYARHWVHEAVTPYSPKIRGLSDLHFPDLESIRNRYFDSERGREEISHDIGHFIQDGTVRFYAQEHILKNKMDEQH